jgi:hypothetical protein
MMDRPDARKPSYSTNDSLPYHLAFSHTQEDIHLYRSSSHRKLFGNRTLSPEYKRINSDETIMPIKKSPDHVIVKKKALGEIRWQVFPSFH